MTRSILFNRRRTLGAAAGLGLAAGFGRQAAAAASDDAVQPDPRLAGYEMPLEEAPHARTLMQWPVAAGVYGDRDLRRVQKTIATIANAIAEFEPVALMADADHAEAARAAVSRAVDIWDIPTNDLWCRDSGPTFVRNAAGDLAVAHIHFNGWGNKQIHNHDGLIAERVAERLGVPLLETGLVGEQGGVEHDGAGTVMALASCWVNRNRNALDADEIGRRLIHALGGKNMIWAPGLKGRDITDYHIDALARFVGPGRVLIQLPARNDAADPYAVASYQAYDILRDAAGPEGKPLEITVLRDPVDTRVQRASFVASYVNFYVCNQGVIAAQFGDARADERARATISGLYPGRKVVTLNVDPLGESGGGIHCATQQLPESAKG